MIIVPSVDNENIPLRRKNTPNEVAIAIAKQINCRKLIPSNIFSLYSVISFGILTSIILCPPYIALHIDLAQRPVEKMPITNIIEAAITERSDKATSPDELPSLSKSFINGGAKAKTRNKNVPCKHTAINPFKKFFPT